MMEVLGERYPGIAGTIQISQFQWCSRADTVRYSASYNITTNRAKNRPSGNSETVRDENYAGDSVNPLPCMQGNGLRNVWPQTT